MPPALRRRCGLGTFVLSLRGLCRPIVGTELAPPRDQSKGHVGYSRQLKSSHRIVKSPTSSSARARAEGRVRVRTRRCELKKDPEQTVEHRLSRAGGARSGHGTGTKEYV